MANKKLPFREEFGCVGVKGVVYMNITYWVDVERAREMQAEMIRTGTNQKYEPDFSHFHWFSSDDFDDLLRRLKLADDAFDVCIRARQGSDYFSYSNKVGVHQPLVEVVQYKGGELPKDTDQGILGMMNNRWGGCFCIFPGPLKLDQ